jgi:voltage-gated potassium channel Kch
VSTAVLLREHFPALRLFARAHNRKHAYRLMDLGVQVIQRETLLSAADLGREVLVDLGLGVDQASETAARFLEHDQRRLDEYHSMHNDEEKMRDLAKESARELEEMFARDADELADK